MVTDRAVEGPRVIWGVEDLNPPDPNITLLRGNLSREREEQEIRESLAQHFLSQEGVANGEGAGAQLSFWDKYFEIQVRGEEERGVFVYNNLWFAGAHGQRPQ